MASGQGTHYAPQSQQEEQNMLDLAMALSMCDVDNASRPNSRPNSRPQSPRVAPEQRKSPLGGSSTSSASLPVPVPAPMHPTCDTRRSPPAELTTPSAPPLTERPPDRTGSPSVAPQQRFTARTNSGRARECHKCRKPLTHIGWPNGNLQDSQERVAGIEIGGKLYHPECVMCEACGKPIKSTQEMHKGGRYHAKCHRRKYGIICDCCHNRIEGEGPQVYFLHSQFWNERYCTKHESDGSVSCTGCARMRRPQSDDIAEIGDGRVLCLECLSSIVPDTAAAQPLYDEIVEFYRTQLHMQIPDVPPLMLVENSGLNEACDREGRSGALNHGPVTHTRGLCLIERVSSIRTGRIAKDAQSGSLTSSSEMVKLQVDPNCNVIAIIVLAGLPRVVTGAVIAHELMHAWLREHGIRKLPEQVEEGLCQLMSYLWIEAQQLEDDPLQARLASYVGYTIRTHPSEVYGKGFILALEAYQRLGLKRLLDHVRLTTAFPDP